MEKFLKLLLIYKWIKFLLLVPRDLGAQDGQDVVQVWEEPKLDEVLMTGLEEEAADQGWVHGDHLVDGQVELEDDGVDFRRFFR